MVTNLRTSESRTFSDDVISNSSPKRWTREVISDSDAPHFLMLNCKGAPTTDTQAASVGGSGLGKVRRDFSLHGLKGGPARRPFSIKTSTVEALSV